LIAEIGHYSLLLALVFALFQIVASLTGAARRDAALIRSGDAAAQTQFVFVLISFGALVYAFATSDFSVQNVYMNSHTLKPLLYKITGVWGNHEGSMLLWVLILSIFGAMVATFGNSLRGEFRARVVAVQGLVGLAFLAFIVITSNPFLRLDPAPFEGRGLNPILQDPALAIHPPLLYAGYVGLSMAFSFAVAALLEGRVDAVWARWVRPWTLAAWMFLTVGIAMGSWWAYYELGWGGWWFWDPVENASLMPWLAATALLHSAIVVEKRDALKIWTVLLAVLAFSLSLIGTFLVRSGVLTSVHAFAVDPERGVFILGILFTFIGGSLALFAWRAPMLKAGGLFAPISREGGLIVNNLLLVTACATVFVGTLYPLGLEVVTGQKISVGAPFFNATFGPLIIPLLILVPFGPFLAWKRGDLAAVAQRLLAALAIALAAGAVAFAVKYGGPTLAPFGIALGVWLIAGALSEVAFRCKAFRAPLRTTLERAWKLPRSAWGTALAHAGLGVAVIGIVAVSSWRVENISLMKPGSSIDVAGYQVTFQGTRPVTGPNYRDTEGSFAIARDGALLMTLTSAKRRYIGASSMTTSEAAIHGFWSGDLYIVLGDKMPVGGYTVRAYFNPLARLIWIGAVIMFFGGAISLFDRRYRVGAPRRARFAAASRKAAA